MNIIGVNSLRLGDFKYNGSIMEVVGNAISYPLITILTINDMTKIVD